MLQFDLYSFALLNWSQKKTSFSQQSFGWDLMDSRYPKNALQKLDGKNDSQNSFPNFGCFPAWTPNSS